MLPSLLLALVALLATGCGSGRQPLLGDVALSSPWVAPSGAGEARPTSLSYSLSRAAAVDIYAVSGSGERLYLRKGESRPVAGSYLLSLDGSYAPDPAGPERRVLPSGAYDLVVEARDSGGAVQQTATRVEVRDSDTSPPGIEGLALSPAAVSPNADGVDDTTRISYRTTERATVTIYARDSAGKRHLLERAEGRSPGHHSLTFDGQAMNQLLPSGSYQVGVEARDAAGNVSVAESTLRIDAASVPDARLMAVRFEPQRLLLGETVTVEFRVKNTGSTVLRTQGPDPEYTYSSRESFSSVESGALVDRRGLWRVGIDWTGVPETAGTKYPFRWGLGKDLQPGEEVTVVGHLRLDHAQPRLWLHAALIQERVRYWDAELGRTAIEIGS